MAEQLKRPVGGAYGVFLNEKREEFKKQAEAKGEKGVTYVTKLAGAAWKALSEAQKAPYEAKYAAAKEKYDAFKASDDYVAPEPKEKKGKKGKKGEAKPAKDKDAPKRPAGGAYGVFMNEKREEFTKEAAKAGDTGFGAAAKLTSAAWKKMDNAAKAPYEKKYQENKAKYEEDLAKYRLSKPAPEEASPPPAKGAKRAATSPAKTAPAAKRGRKEVATAAATEGVALDADVLKEADGLGYRANLENLARRKAIVDGGFKGAKILTALRASGGLVNKAQAALRAACYA